ncbi:hypothetical protein [Flavobacterium sp. GT3P67]|uniref:hypothetical protein n=1 Tax=Flavobacterium sp. GT3P67 TaxID=2541722 RepID=UPI00140488B1|nr:hypothetical protein [Flavobacterium sp. GT3P67]
MRIFTNEEAKSITKYYSEKIVEMPITKPDNSNPFLISPDRVAIPQSLAQFCKLCPQ